MRSPARFAQRLDGVARESAALPGGDHMTDPAPFLLRMPWPAGTPITQEFGAMDSGYAHRGRDAGCVVGTPIVTPADGQVVDFVNSFTTWNGEQVRSFGNGVCVSYGNGLYGLVAHLSRVDVKLDQFVQAGQQLGLSGNTGVSTGPHCHYQICSSTSFPTDIAYSRDPRLFLISEADMEQIARLERLLVGNGYIATPRPDAGNARYSQIFAEELALQGGKLTEYRGSPPVAGGKVSAISVSAEGVDGPAYMLTGERALKYADWRGFSLGLALEYKSNAS